jgi:hypothetical protein
VEQPAGTLEPYGCRPRAPTPRSPARICWWACWPTGPTSRSASCAASASILPSSGRTCAAGTWQPEAASR